MMFYLGDFGWLNDPARDPGSGLVRFGGGRQFKKLELVHVNVGDWKKRWQVIEVREILIET